METLDVVRVTGAHDVRDGLYMVAGRSVGGVLVYVPSTGSTVVLDMVFVRDGCWESVR